MPRASWTSTATPTRAPDLIAGAPTCPTAAELVLRAPVSFLVPRAERQLSLKQAVASKGALRGPCGGMVDALDSKSSS